MKRVIKTIFKIITLQFEVEIKQTQQTHCVPKEYLEYVENPRNIYKEIK